MTIIKLNDHLSYELSEHVRRVCQPLFKSLGFNYFDYARFYPNQTYIVLYSDPEWVEYFLNEESYYNLPPIQLYAGAHLWNRYIDPRTLQSAKQLFSHSHGITLKTDYPHYTEIVNFSTHPSNLEVFDLYLNKIHVLHRFKDYFIRESIKQIHMLEQHPMRSSIKIGATKNHEPNVDEIMSIIGHTNRQVEATLPNFPALNSLTFREKDCLNALISGLSAKEIAREMALSPRTVENHLDNIKRKLNCRTRTQLLCTLLQHQYSPSLLDRKEN